MRCHTMRFIALFLSMADTQLGDLISLEKDSPRGCWSLLLLSSSIIACDHTELFESWEVVSSWCIQVIFVLINLV